MSTTTMHRTGRSLITTGLFNRLSARVADEAHVETSEAEAIVDQTLVFLLACAQNPTLMLSPSPRVDIGWHAFLLHTRDYQEFCTRVAGRFIHHTPTTPTSDAAADPTATHEALARTGLAVDWSHWHCDAADCKKCKQCKNCTQCYQGCHDSP